MGMAGGEGERDEAAEAVAHHDRPGERKLLAHPRHVAGEGVDGVRLRGRIAGAMTA
jgi:hypothetical protein